jgi:hypothetical protein
VTSNQDASSTTATGNAEPPHCVEEPYETEIKSVKRRINSISEPEDTTKRRLSKRVKAQEDTAAEVSDFHGEEYIKALNAVLWPHVFGDYSSLDFFARDFSDGTVDLWKSFLSEWSAERALPFETNYKNKYLYINRIILTN